jgi:hypothetical protein
VLAVSYHPGHLLGTTPVLLEGNEMEIIENNNLELTE